MLDYLVRVGFNLVILLAKLFTFYHGPRYTRIELPCLGDLAASGGSGDAGNPRTGRFGMALMNHPSLASLASPDPTEMV